MIPRGELTELLRERLQDALPQPRIDQLAGEILDLESGWEEIDISHSDMGYSTSPNCSDICWLSEQIDRGAIIKLYRKKKN
jgi:hypothetical protein